MCQYLTPLAITCRNRPRSLAILYGLSFGFAFEVIGREFIERRLGSKAEGHRSKVQRRLELYVFPYLGRRPVSAITAPEILAVLHRIESRGTLETAHRALKNIGHGWRAAVRTLLHERLDYDPYVIEHQLAHAVPDALGSVYNRTKFLKERKAMMQRWADHLDTLSKGGGVVPFQRSAH